MNQKVAPELVVATSNPGKIAEFRAMLPASIVIYDLSDLEVVLPAETAETFAGNAATKATTTTRQTGQIAIADDSGLEIDALYGAPGVRSARYAGEPPNDLRNIDLVLSSMSVVPDGQRSARIRSAVAIAHPDGRLEVRQGSLEGAIARSPLGDHGFGYDPIFLLPDGRTLAQVEPGEKHRISHRAKAYKLILPILFDWLGLTEDVGTCTHDSTTRHAS